MSRSGKSTEIITAPRNWVGSCSFSTGSVLAAEFPPFVMRSAPLQAMRHSDAVSPGLAGIGRCAFRNDRPGNTRVTINDKVRPNWAYQSGAAIGTHVTRPRRRRSNPLRWTTLNPLPLSRVLLCDTLEITQHSVISRCREIENEPLVVGLIYL